MLIPEIKTGYWVLYGYCGYVDWYTVHRTKYKRWFNRRRQGGRITRLVREVRSTEGACDRITSTKGSVDKCEPGSTW